MSYIVVDNKELCHYGILGQKWGVRRFQNDDGTLTSEGKKRYGSVKEMKKEARKEYRADNKKAFDLGKKATIDEKAAQIAKFKMVKSAEKMKKLDEKYADVKQGKGADAKQKAFRKAVDDYYNYIALNNRAVKSYKEVEAHYNTLVKKYGKDAVKDIAKDSNGRIDEKVETNMQVAARTLALAAAEGAFVTVASLFAPGASTIGATIGLANTNYLMTKNASITAGNKAYRSYVKEQDKREKETKRLLRNAVKTYTVEGY